MSIDLNTLALLGIAAFNALTAFLASLTAFLAWRTRQAAVATKHTVEVLEMNTNSIKDELVAVTAESSEAKGVLLGRAQVADEQKKT